MITVSSLEDIYKAIKEEKDLNMKTKVIFKHPKKNLKKQTCFGRAWINHIVAKHVPANKFEFIDYDLDKKTFKAFLDDIYEKVDHQTYIDLLVDLNREAFYMHMFEPVSFNIKDFIIPNEIKKKIRERLSADLSPVEYQKEVYRLAEELMEYLKKNDSGFYDMIVSGAKGNVMDVGVLLISRGYTLNIEGEISKKPVMNSVTSGFTPEEFYLNANEARRGLFIRAAGTAEPGEIARDVIFACSPIILVDGDCGTKKYFEVKVTKSVASRLLKRYYLEGSKLKRINSIEDVLKYEGRVIKLRSPLYCKNKKGICSICYGATSDEIGTTHIGVLAGTAITVEGIENYTMKARHQASQVKLEEVDFEKDLII